MRPTIKELEDLFWRSFWTFASVFVGGVAAANTFDEVGYEHAAFTAGISVLTNVVLVYLRQKAPNTGINANAPTQVPERGGNK